MEHYSPLVKYAARRLHNGLPDSVEMDDLISAGNLGLMDAISNYDPAKGVKFETYCSPRIRGSILDDLREKDRLPRLVRFRAKQLAKARQLLEARFSRKPTESEIAAELGMDTEEFNRLQRDANVVSLLSLDTKNSDADSEKVIREIEVIKNEKSQDPLAKAEKRDLKDLVTKGLTPAEKLILTLYYYEELTMKEIGITLGLSESRVSQVHSSILARLKAQLHNREREF
jgi:RNA polymerase sigma factor for flagellar operon FliA